MSTNYYVHTQPSCGGKCSRHCHGEEIHLGKSSAGWAFAFRAYPEPSPVSGPEAVTWPVKDFASWTRLLDLGEIRAEHGLPATREEMLALVESKRGGLNDYAPTFGEFLDPDGNRFSPGDFC